MKTCKGKCGKTLPKTRDNFYFTAQGWAMSRCKECHKEYTKENGFIRRERLRLEIKYKKDF